ncbi:arsenic resistance N-acetyltransferase ArsN2 [Luteimonas panaciterrae]|uniref:arsenic resistance N-acetyltransferase ArsN2 n=1 Tax=Luteimonas panaciterrae TaxID=363885 RepID=UPI001CFBEF71|nr:arsenic resistance N-acetyltransferase ArsN2 [Luteimonas panaciterrae]
MNIRPATPQDEERIRDLLADAHLPVLDLDQNAPDQSRVEFLVAEGADGIVGAVGLQAFGNVGLLRSLVLAPSIRGAGHGSRLLAALETTARDRGVGELLLLTETAAPFFSKHGYVVADRGAAPASIRETAEFRALCPATATCMSKRLATP